MTARCPEGHLTRSTDFCDICGEPVPAQLSPNRLPEGRRVMGNRSANRRDQPMPGRNALGRPTARPAAGAQRPEPPARQRPQEWLQGQPGRPGDRPSRGPAAEPAQEPAREPARGPQGLGRRPVQRPEQPLRPPAPEPGRRPERPQARQSEAEDEYGGGEFYQGYAYDEQADEYDDQYGEAAAEAPAPGQPGRPVVEPPPAPEFTIRQQPPSRRERPVPEADEPQVEEHQPDEVDVVDWVADVWIDAEWYASQHGDTGCPPEGVVDVVPLVHSPVLIGRRSRSRGIVPDVDCGPDHGASRRHAELGTDGERWWVEDVGSANGTFLGHAGRPLPTTPIPAEQPIEIHPGDQIYVGAWTRIVVRPAGPDETDPASFDRAWADDEDSQEQNGYHQQGYDAEPGDGPFSPPAGNPFPPVRRHPER